MTTSGANSTFSRGQSVKPCGWNVGRFPLHVWYGHCDCRSMISMRRYLVLSVFDLAIKSTQNKLMPGVHTFHHQGYVSLAVQLVGIVGGLIVFSVSCRKL